MSFISLEFLTFFGLVCALYAWSSHRFQNLLLLAGSYVFYGWWDWRFLGLILVSSIVDYTCGLLADPNRPEPASPKRRRLAVVTSVVANLGILATFKYFDFFSASLKAGLEALGVGLDLGTLDVVLPVGISFYTFQTMSYTIDVYRGEIRATRRVDDLFLYVAFFPQLVAGPIERGSRLLPQVTEPRNVTTAHRVTGAQLMLLGFFKKMVVADNLAPFVDSVFRNPDPTGGEVILGTVAFAFQIYADFSAYTDIARGGARILGFDLVRNFRMPYLATNPSDFWQRWHISLSSWLRDYLYIPLGGNRRGRTRTFINLLLTMLLGGLWHGAAWTFVLWGAYHGALLGIFHAFIPRSKAREATEMIRGGPRFYAKVTGFFVLTCVGWLIFRAESIDQVIAFGGAIVTNLSVANLPLPSLWLIVLVATPLIVLDHIRYRSGEPEPWIRWSASGQAAFIVSLFYATVLLGSPHDTAFIYFQF